MISLATLTPPPGGELDILRGAVGRVVYVTPAPERSAFVSAAGVVTWYLTTQQAFDAYLQAEEAAKTEGTK